MIKIRIIVFFILCFLGLSSLNAQQTDLEKMLSAPFPSSLVSDPLHDQIAWVMNEKGIRNVWIAKGPDYAPRQITKANFDIGRSISRLRFSKDGESLFFVNGDGANRRGEFPNPAARLMQKNEATSINIIDLNTYETKTLGNGSLVEPGYGILNLIIKKGKIYLVRYDAEEIKDDDLLFDVRGSISEAIWVPNSEQLKIAFISRRGDHALAGIYDIKDEKIEWLTPSVDSDMSIVSSPDGNKVAFLRIPSERDRFLFAPIREAFPWSIMVTNVNTMKTTKVWTAAKGYGSMFRNISADKQLMWTCNNQLVFPYEKEGYTHLFSIDADGKNLQNLTPGKHEVQFVNQSPDKCEILFSSNLDDTDRQHIWSYNFNNKLKKQITSGNGVEWSPIKSNTGNYFCLSSGGTTPAHISKIESGIPKNMMPATIPSIFNNEEIIAPTQVIFNAKDGMRIHGQLFKPSVVDASKKLPAVLFFHGGSRRQMLLGYHHRGYYHNMYALNQYLASQGYAVLSVNFRSGIGYGLEFREALGYGADGASEYNDVLAGADYLKSLPFVDANRIGLWGGSYGGYLTALGLSRNSDIFKAGVDIHGVHDWNEIIKGFMPNYNPLEHPKIAEKAFASSPMNFLEGWTSPVLLIHGDDDRNVPFSETVDIVEQLRKRDVYFEQLIFPDEVHGFLLHQNWVDALSATFDFFERKLK